MKQAGFTLFETVIGMAIAGMVLTAAYGAYAGSVAVSERAERRALLAMAAENVLSSLIANAGPGTRKTEGQTEEGYLYCARFVPRAVTSGAAVRPVEIFLELRDGETGASFTLATVRLMGGG